MQQDETDEFTRRLSSDEKMDETGVPAEATPQGSPIVGHATPQYDEENVRKSAERDRSWAETLSKLRELGKFYAKRDRVDKEVRRIIDKEGGGDDSKEDIDEDIKDLVLQRLAEIDKEVGVEREKARIKWQAKQETAPTETKEDPQDSEENKEGKKQS